MGFQGSKFMWSNKREIKSLVEMRLDRFTCYSAWEARFNFSRVQNVFTTGSDHSPILVAIDSLNSNSWAELSGANDFITKNTGATMKNAN